MSNVDDDDEHYPPPEVLCTLPTNNVHHNPPSPPQLHDRLALFVSPTLQPKLTQCDDDDGVGLANKKLALNVLSTLIQNVKRLAAQFPTRKLFRLNLK